MSEKWLDIEGYEGYYQVSNLGRVRSLDRILLRDSGSFKRKGVVLSDNKDTKGYNICGLCDSKGRGNGSVHRLVAQAFIANPENKPQVNHINGIKDDNRVENLEWCTSKENVNHSVLTGLHIAAKGSKQGSSKLTEKAAMEIYNMAHSGDFIQEDIGRLFSVKQSVVSSIKTKRSWKHIHENNN